jgi:E3 ubiquitin-protein ligase MYCBP2
LSVSPFTPPARLPNPIPLLDDKKRPVSVEAWLHFSEFRLRCRHCETVFCAACKRVPYHLGFTCQQYSDFLRARECRFCGVRLEDAKPDASAPPAFRDVCSGAECREKLARSCDKMLPCGCPCQGVRGESECLPCLRHELQCGDDYCPVCWVEELRRDACIRMQGKCSHVVHLACVKRQLAAGYPNARISFQFKQCPLCKSLRARRIILVLFLLLCRVPSRPRLALAQASKTSSIQRWRRCWRRLRRWSSRCARRRCCG